MVKKRRLFGMVLIVVSVVAAVVFVPWTIVQIWLTPLPDTVQQQVNDAVGYGLDGVIVYIDQNGKPPACYAAGWNNRENRVPANPKAQFKIASISKLYIAAAAAHLAAANRLQLNKTLAAYLPNLSASIENAHSITLRMLLQHRSGIPDFIHDARLPWDNLPAGTNQYLALVAGKPAHFEPGSRYEYSNTNYLLVAAIIDKTLGYSHRQFIKETLLDTLGVSQTFGLLSQADTSKLMSGYLVGYQGNLKTQNYIVPGGSMVSTARETGIFLRALNNGTLLNNKAQQIYTALYQYEHTGLLPGYSSIARYHQQADAVIVMFANTSGGNSWTVVEQVYKRIAQIVQKNTAYHALPQTPGAAH